jgi:hypothetical protein
VGAPKWLPHRGRTLLLSPATAANATGANRLGASCVAHARRALTGGPHPAEREPTPWRP